MKGGEEIGQRSENGRLFILKREKKKIHNKKEVRFETRKKKPPGNCQKWEDTKSFFARGREIYFGQGVCNCGGGKRKKRPDSRFGPPKKRKKKH